MNRWHKFVGVTVTVVWAAMYVRALIDPSFSAPPEVSVIMLVIVTWLFAVEGRRRNGNGNGNGNGGSK